MRKKNKRWLVHFPTFIAATLNIYSHINYAREKIYFDLVHENERRMKINGTKV